MPTTALNYRSDSRLHVVVGVIRRDDQCVLLQQRLPGKPCAGQWEFPGGKVEAGESSQQALQRELKEELGIEVLTLRALMELPFDYHHAQVWLEVFMVDSFVGNVIAQEGQQTSWLKLKQIRQLNLLAAVHPMLETLEASGNLSL